MRHCCHSQLPSRPSSSWRRARSRHHRSLRRSRSNRAGSPRGIASGPVSTAYVGSLIDGGSRGSTNRGRNDEFVEDTGPVELGYEKGADRL